MKLSVAGISASLMPEKETWPTKTSEYTPSLRRL